VFSSFVVNFLFGQPAAPVDVRALAVKSEFADVENLKSQMLTKDEMVAEMKRILKAKVRGVDR